MEGLKTLPEFARRRFDPNERYGLRATLFGIAVALVGVPFGILLDQVVRHGGLLHADTAAARRLHVWIQGRTAVIWTFKAITFVGTPQWFFLLVGGVAVFLAFKHRYRLVAFLLTTVVGGGIIDSVVKIVVGRDRPDLDNPLIPLHGKSFPSGHAMSSTIVYGSLLLIFMPVIPVKRRRIAITGVVILVLAIGFTRLALGVHFLTDVLGGYTLGLAWLAASTAAFSIWREERGRKPVTPTKGLEPEAKRDIADIGRNRT